MSILFAGGFFALMFGAIVGSFLNVVAIRYNTGTGLRGRSQCLSCTRRLGALQLIPVVSFIALRGRCHSCKSAISFQYPLVEAITALTFLGTYSLMIGGALTPYMSILMVIAFSLMIVITVYDLRHQIIPNMIVYLLLTVGIIRVALAFHGGEEVAARVVAAFSIAIVFALLWLFSKGQWMGLGDAKLVLALALLLPYPDNLEAVMLAFWTGALVGLALVAIGKLRSRGRLTIESEIPFAPFLILGFYIAFFVPLPILPL